MQRTKKTSVVLTSALGAAMAIAACDPVNYLNSNPQGTTPVGELTKGQINASRLIDTAFTMVDPKFLYLDVLQFIGLPGETRCDPLGLNGGVKWQSRLLGPKIFRPDLTLFPSQYDYLCTINETDDVISLRVPEAPLFPLHFSQIEFNLRAVNPFANGHLPGNDYALTQADFPSNDDVIGNRRLIVENGGDVAIIVQGIDFVGLGGPTATTVATMNFLGPSGWVFFMRDNALQSGRFFNVTGSLKGGPRALEDSPPAGDEGFFESVQVNGENPFNGGFDGNCEPVGNMNSLTFLTCAGLPTKHYAFLDRSNRNEVDTMGAIDNIATPDDDPGAGGFLFVIRREAFNSAGVVVNPDTVGSAPTPVAPSDLLLSPPGSGYNELLIPNINGGAAETNHAPGGVPDGVPGVHEIGWSVFFIHGS